MAKKRKKAKKTIDAKVFSLLLIIVAMALYLGVVWFFITDTYQHKQVQTSGFSTGQTFTGEDFSKSLDLRVAARASYPSSAITTVKDLGVEGSVHQQIINFNVNLDNLSEYALMYLPAGKAPAQGYPTIILCHGYYDPSQYQTTSGYLEDMTFYAQHGFAVIKPDFRGQGLSLNQGRPEGAYYSMAYNTDVMSLITAVEDTGYLDKNDINLWGHSMGAYIALRAAVLSPKIKNLILISGPVGNPEDMFNDYMAASDKDNPLALSLRDVELLKYGTPATDPKFWDSTSPINYLPQLKANVQIHVGSADKVVPPEFSADLDGALSKAGKAHQYFVYDGGDHGLMAQRPLIWQRSLDLLAGGTGSQ